MTTARVLRSRRFVTVSLVLAGALLALALARLRAATAHVTTERAPGDLALVAAFSAGSRPGRAPGPPADDRPADVDVRPRFEELLVDDASRAEIEAHWTGWAFRARRAWTEHHAPLPLILFDARTPSLELSRAELAASDEPHDVALAWRPMADASRSAHVQLLAFEARRVRVLATCVVRGTSAPDPADVFVPAWRRAYPEAVIEDWGVLWPAYPIVVALSWCGGSAPERAAARSWPSYVNGTRLGSGGGERARACSGPIEDWSWPVWFLGTERPDPLTTHRRTRERP